MTQFLTRLAARTLELTPTVQPRIASVFNAEFGQDGLLESSVEVPATAGIPPSSESRIAPSLLMNDDRSTLAIAHVPSAIRAERNSPGTAPQAFGTSAPQIEPPRYSPGMDEVTAATPRPVDPTTRPTPLPDFSSSAQLSDRAQPSLFSESHPPIFSASDLPAEVNAAQADTPPHVPPTIQPQTIPFADPSVSRIEPNSAIQLQRTLSEAAPDPPVTHTVHQPIQPQTDSLESTEPTVSATRNDRSSQARSHHPQSAVQPNLGVNPSLPTTIERTVVDREVLTQSQPSLRETVRSTVEIEPRAAILPVVVPRPTETIRAERNSTATVPPVVSPRVSTIHHPQSREQPAAPTIHVTIGRIEVRAVAPPPAPTRTRSAAQPVRMSLEDYLRLRNGGRP